MENDHSKEQKLVSVKTWIDRIGYSGVISTLILGCLVWIGIELHDLADRLDAVSPMTMNEFKLDRKGNLNRLPLVRVFDIVQTTDVDVGNTIDVNVINADDFQR